MVRKLAEKKNDNFDWTDVTAPDSDELHEIALKYNLHESSVQDCLQPDHLPKYEVVGDYVFIILRIYNPDPVNDADSVQELTDKIAIFLTDSCIITIHKYEWEKMEDVKNTRISNGTSQTAFLIFNEIVKMGLLSFEEPALNLTKAIENYETKVFLKQKKVTQLKGLYFVKRKIDVIRRILILTYEIVDKIDRPETSNTYTRDLRDMYVRLHNVYDSLSENTKQVLHIYFSTSAQRTNEIIRVLTILSVFFMPLTFIVGVYGMNFDFMPELRWKAGYPGIIILMSVVTFGIYLWFKRKGWLN